jgi:hypothetical protein
VASNVVGTTTCTFLRTESRAGMDLDLLTICVITVPVQRPAIGLGSLLRHQVLLTVIPQL